MAGRRSATTPDPTTEGRTSAAVKAIVKVVFWRVKGESWWAGWKGRREERCQPVEEGRAKVRQRARVTGAKAVEGAEDVSFVLAHGEGESARRLVLSPYAREAGRTFLSVGRERGMVVRSEDGRAKIRLLWAGRRTHAAAASFAAWLAAAPTPRRFFDDA